MNVFDQAKDLLRERGSWTKGSAARLKNGEPTGQIDHPDACQWCVYGAVMKVLGPTTQISRGMCLTTMSNEIKGSPAIFNDAPERTHPEILAFLQRCSERWEREHP